MNHTLIIVTTLLLTSPSVLNGTWNGSPARSVSYEPISTASPSRSSKRARCSAKNSRKAPRSNVSESRSQTSKSRWPDSNTTAPTTPILVMIRHLQRRSAVPATLYQIGHRRPVDYHRTSISTPCSRRPPAPSPLVAASSCNYPPVVVSGLSNMAGVAVNNPSWPVAMVRWLRSCQRRQGRSRSAALSAAVPQ